MGSELAQRVGINEVAESMMAFNTNYKDTGLFGVYAVANKDCLDDLSYAIMYETTKLAYRVSEDDVTRACNQVSTIAPILRSLFALLIQCEKWNLAFACMIC